MKAARSGAMGTVVVSGGVAANSRLREKMTAAGREAGVRVLFPSLGLCTDNAAMIAGAAWHLAREGLFSDYSFRPSARMKGGES